MNVGNDTHLPYIGRYLELLRFYSSAPILAQPCYRLNDDNLCIEEHQRQGNRTYKNGNKHRRLLVE